MASRKRGRPRAEDTTARDSRSARAYLERQLGRDVTVSGLLAISAVSSEGKGDSFAHALRAGQRALSATAIQRAIRSVRAILGHRSLAADSKTRYFRLLSLTGHVRVDEVEGIRQSLALLGSWADLTDGAIRRVDELASRIDPLSGHAPIDGKALEQRLVVQEVAAWLRRSKVTKDRASIAAHLELAANRRERDEWELRRRRWVEALRNSDSHRYSLEDWRHKVAPQPARERADAQAEEWLSLMPPDAQSRIVAEALRTFRPKKKK